MRDMCILPLPQTHVPAPKLQKGDNRIVRIQRVAGSPVTARAVCLGLLCAVVVNLMMNYNDYYLRNTLLMGNHFPTASVAVLLVLILGVNAALANTGGRFSQGELLLVWGMVGVAGGIGASGLMRYLPGWLVGPAYYATNANEYDTMLLPHLPSWMVVTRDVNSRAAGTSPGASGSGRSRSGARSRSCSTESCSRSRRCSSANGASGSG